MDEHALIDLAGGTLRWLQHGRTPIARGPAGIVRVGPPTVLDAEEAGRVAATQAGAAQAPQTIRRIEGALLETDLGDSLPGEPPPLFPQQNPTTHTASLGELLTGIDPPGGVNVTPLVRALRRLDGPLPFRPKAALLQRALRQTVTVSLTRGPTHGALTPVRVLTGGVCHWQRFRVDGVQQQDCAAWGPLDTPGVALCALKWGWRFDARRAAEALVALGVIAPTGEAITLSVSAHPGLTASDLSRILGCSPGTVTATQAARAQGRAKGLSIGGVPLTVSVSPPVPPRSDPGFRQPRGRDPRRLFDRYHQGIRLDEQARYSLTPQRAAEAIAAALPGPTVVDGFCGAGGNAIALARAGRRVIAIDTSAKRLAMARHNAGVYGVTDRITFQRGDFFALTPSADACFLDPPWAGGEELLDRAWSHGRKHYRRGLIKLPRTHPVPEAERLRVFSTPEGFPSFVTAAW